MYLLKLAFRNVFRQRRRSIITFMAIAFGIMVTILSWGMMAGVDRQVFENVVYYQTGDIKIFTKGYFEEIDELPLDISINNFPEVYKMLKDDRDIVYISPRLSFRGLLNNGRDELPVNGIGIVDKLDQKVFKIAESVTEGNYTIKGSGQMLAGFDLANDLKRGLGDTLTLLTRTRYDTFQALDLQIAGLVATGNPLVDKMTVFIPLSLAQESLDMLGKVTEISIKLKPNSNVDLVAARLNEKFGEKKWKLEALTWEKLAEDVLKMSETKLTFMFVFIGVVIIIATVGIVNTMLLAAYERIREIGTLLSMGMQRKQIIRLFILEGTIIGFLGSLTGCIMGVLINAPMVIYGIDMEKVMPGLKDMDFGYPIKFMFYSDWGWSMVAFCFVFGILISLIVSYYPAKIASKMEPTEALRHL